MDLLADIGELLRRQGAWDRPSYLWLVQRRGYRAMQRYLVYCAVTPDPDVVIETGWLTGSAAGSRSRHSPRMIKGHLWSIHFPHPFNHKLHGQTGVAVTDAYRPRWTYSKARASDDCRRWSQR